MITIDPENLILVFLQTGERVYISPPIVEITRLHEELGKRLGCHECTCFEAGVSYAKEEGGANPRISAQRRLGLRKPPHPNWAKPCPHKSRSPAKNEQVAGTAKPIPICLVRGCMS